MADEVRGVDRGGLNGLHRRHAVLDHERKLTGVDTVGTDPGIRAVGHFHAGPHRLGEVAALRLAQIAVVRQKIRRRIRGGLYALLIVDIHDEISAVLLGKSNALIVDQRRVLDRCHPCANRILDALGGMRVRGHAQSEAICLLDGGAQLFRGELYGFGIAAMREHRAGGEDLDVIGAAMGNFTDLLTHFPGAVRHAVLQIPRQLDIRSQTGHRSGAFADGDVGARHVHARAHDDSSRNGIAHGHIVQGPVHAHIAHRGEPGEQRNTCVRDGRIGSFSGGSLQDVNRFGRCEVREMGVAVHQSRQHPHVRQVDDLHALGNLEIGPDGLYLGAPDEDDLVRQGASRFDVDEFARAYGEERSDRRRLLRRRRGGEKHTAKSQQNNLIDQPTAPRLPP